MGNYKLDANVGNNFDDVAQKAKKISNEKNVIVEFDFNGVKCLVNKDTNTELLYRDYSNSWKMEWKEVGFDCVENYSIEIANELQKRTKIAEEKAEAERAEYRRKDKIEKDLFDEKVKGISIELLNEKEWNDFVKANSSPYGKAAVDYAEGWAKLMQVEISKGKTIIECAGKTSFELGFMGITGFMYGCAVQMLSKCWKHGETLRKWHNKEYKHEGEGVVNPAIITIR